MACNSLTQDMGKVDITFIVHFFEQGKKQL